MARPSRQTAELITDPNSISDLRQIVEKTSQDKDHLSLRLEEMTARHDALERDYEEALEANSSLGSKIAELEEAITKMDPQAAEELKVDGDYIWCIIPKERGMLTATIGGGSEVKNQVEVILNGERKTYPCEKYIAIHKDHAQLLGINVK